jgi:naphtho-gamma-pyrone polyketide synthase
LWAAVSPGLKTVNLPIHAPYHAPHLYSISDIDTVLEVNSSLSIDAFVSRISVSSSTTGQVLPAGLTYRELLRRVLKEILLAPLHLDKTVRGVAALLNSFKITQCNVLTIASANIQGLAASLRQSTDASITIDDGVAQALHTRTHEVDSGRLEHSNIAIVGFSGRFPDAANTEDFWSLLHKGLDVHRVVPPDRFDVDAHFDITGRRKNTSKIRHGCWINEPGLFDARFFNISPREAAQADPGQRLALQTAYEALEMAGIVPDRTPSTQRDRVGIFYGMTSDDWREVNSGQNVDTYFIPGGNRAFTPGRINYYFKFSGQSLSVDTACSSSLAAIHLGKSPFADIQSFIDGLFSLQLTLDW